MLGYAWLALEAHRGRARLGLAAGFLLVATPYLAAWYVVWALPLAAAEDDPPAQWLAVGLSAYLLRQAVPALTVTRRNTSTPSCSNTSRQAGSRRSRARRAAVGPNFSAPVEVAGLGLVGGDPGRVLDRREAQHAAAAESFAPSELVVLTTAPAGISRTARAAIRSCAVTRVVNAP